MELVIDQNQLDEQLKLDVQLLVNEYIEKESTTSNQTANILDLNHQGKFIENLFKLLSNTRYRGGFVQLKKDYDELRNKTQNDVFIFLTKISLELFKLNIKQSHAICQTIIEYANNHVDTNLDAYKIIQLSILGVCYWKEKKFQECLNCMALELNLVAKSNDLNNRYRILDYLTYFFPLVFEIKQLFDDYLFCIQGNIGNAYKLLKNFVKSKAYFKQQLNVSLDIKNRFLTISALNSLGVVYLQCKEFESALRCFNKSLFLINKFQDTTDIKVNLLVKQYFLVGDCYLKLNMLVKARDTFRGQLALLNGLLNQEQMDDEKSESESYFLEISKAQLNLGMIEKKLSNFEECIRLFEITIDYLKLNMLNMNKTIHSYFKFIDIYFKLYLNLINSYLNLSKYKAAQEHTQTLLDFTIKEQSYLAKNEDYKLKQNSLSVKLYLKFIEVYSLSKLGVCNEKLKLFDNSLKLYERELKLIDKYFSSNYILKIRSLMHCANINYLLKNFLVTINLYKDVLGLIEINCNTNDMATNKKLIKFSFYALTNLAECMKTLDQKENAYNIYKEQYELAKYLDNLKLCSISLLNLVNVLDINGAFQQELADYLFNLSDIYVQMNNLNGQLYTSQLIAYYYHKNQSNMDISIKFYLKIIDLCKNTDMQSSAKLILVVQKTLFNLSLCYRQKKMYLESYKYQLEYLCMIKMNVYKDQQESDYLEFEALGIIADLLLNINSNNTEISIRIHVNRLNIIKKYLHIDDNGTFFDQPKIQMQQNNLESQCTNGFTQKRIYLIYDCFESLSKCYYLNDDFENVFKFKFVQFKLCLKNPTLVKFKMKILFDLANLLLFQLNNHVDAKYYFEHALGLCDPEHIKLDDNLLLISLVYGNLGICCTKNEDYVNAAIYFNKQIKLLDDQLDAIRRSNDKTSSNAKEIMSLCLDKGRSLLMLSKCYDSTNSDSLTYLNEHVALCEYLFDTFLNGKYFDLDKSLNYLYEQIFNDYDLILNKLSKYFENVLHSSLKSIDMNKKRLFILTRYKEYLNTINNMNNDANSTNETVYLALLNTEIEINLYIAKLYFDESFLYKSLDYSKFALDLCTNLDNTLCINKYVYIKCLNLNCKLLFETINENANSLSFKNQPSDTESCDDLTEQIDKNTDSCIANQLKLLQNGFLIFPNAGNLTKNVISVIKVILNNSLKSYDLLCTLQLNEQQLKSVKKSLKLNYEILLNLIKCYRYLQKPKKIAKLLNDFKFYLNDKYMQFLKSNVPKENLVDFIDYQYKINFKLCLHELYHNGNACNEAHFNDIEFFLLEHKVIANMNRYEFDLKLAKVYCLKGLFHRAQKKNENSLENFVNALDSIETVGHPNSDTGDDDYFDLKNFVRVLHDNITEILIDLKRLNDALFVCEHYRKSNGLLQTNNSSNLADSFNLILYYHVLKSNSSLNCWLLHYNSPSLVKDFNILNFKQTQLDVTQTENLFIVDATVDFTDSHLSLQRTYDLLIKPFEADLLMYIVDQLEFSNKFRYKPNLIFVHDGHLLPVPLHLLRFQHNTKTFYLYEYFRISTFESVDHFICSDNEANKSEKCRFLNNLSDINHLIDDSAKFKFKLIYVNMKLNSSINEEGDPNIVFQKIRELIKLNVTNSILLKFNSNTKTNENTNKFFDQLLFSLVHSPDEPKQLDGIYTKLLNEYRSNFNNRLPSCYLIGKNVDLSETYPIGNESDPNEYFVYFKNIIWSIIKLNSHTHANSLVNLLIFMLENYLLQNDSLKFGTTLGNLEKRLNLINDNEDDMRTKISIFKCILVKLGFLFACDDKCDGNAVVLVKFPNLNYTRKLEILYKILRIFQNVSSNVLKQMIDSNEKLGEELLLFFEQEYVENATKDILLYDISSNQKVLFSSIVNMMPTSSIEILKTDENKIKISADFLNKFYYIVHMLYDQSEDDFELLVDLLSESKIMINLTRENANNTLVTSAVKSTTNQLDQHNDDQASINSTISSALGIVTKQQNMQSESVAKANGNFSVGKTQLGHEGKISFDTDDELDIGITEQRARVTNKKEIQINPAEYTQELNRMLSISLPRSTTKTAMAPSVPIQSHKHENNRPTLETCSRTTEASRTSTSGKRSSDLNKTISNQQTHKNWTCLIQYEEEEFINKLITTITTRTMSEDTLTFENSVKLNADWNKQAKEKKQGDSRPFKHDLLINKVNFDAEDEDDDDVYENILNEFNPSSDEITLKIMNTSEFFRNP